MLLIMTDGTRIRMLSSYTTLQKNQRTSCAGIIVGLGPTLGLHGRHSTITDRLFTTRSIWLLPGEFILPLINIDYLAAMSFQGV